MKEFHEILNRLGSFTADDNGVLATVVDVKGSSYRLPGAKMLILENGETFGTVSGGCLESDVMERATAVLQSGKPQIFVYDTTNDEDSVFSFNMGCQGVIRIMLEPVRENPYIEFLRCCFEKERGAAATSISSGDGSVIGDRVFFVGDGLDQNEFADHRIRDHAIEVLGEGRSRIEVYDFGEVFFEYIAPPVDIKIFGAGADAVPLAEIAKNLGWHVTVVDHRPALANNERFNDPDEIIISRPEEVSRNVALANDSVAVVMTHNFEHDKQILSSLMNRDLKYLGLLGPKVRTESMLREMREGGYEIADEQLEKLHAPIGLDIGAQLPETIAIAIIAEIQSVLADRNGGFLRERDGSIYGRD